MMKDLAIPLRRIQLDEAVKGDLTSPTQLAVQVAALNVLTTIVETLIFDIHYLTDSQLGRALIFQTILMRSQSSQGDFVREIHRGCAAYETQSCFGSVHRCHGGPWLSKDCATLRSGRIRIRKTRDTSAKRYGWRPCYSRWYHLDF